MGNIVAIKSISIENFKGCKEATYDFNGKDCSVYGANATGKTTIVDAFWWLLFNKDSSGNEKFSVRPLDANGQHIDNVEIKVSAVLLINGAEREFTKVQKQKWVKRRGTDVTELQGNENLYEVDGYPKTEKDFKESVSEIVIEEVFKMVTNPSFFPSLKWKEQRDVLMRFVSEVSDYDLASGNDRFSELLSELQKAPSVDDARAKYQKALTEWKNKQKEIPVRIDEAEKQRVDIDVAELELQRRTIEEKISETKSKRENVANQFDGINEINDAIIDLKAEQVMLKTSLQADVIKKKRDIDEKISDEKALLYDIEKEISSVNRDVSETTKVIESATAKKIALGKDWENVKSEVFDESTTICPTCKRELPESDRKELLEKFEKSKAERLAKIEENGFLEKGRIELAQKSLSDLSEKSKELHAKKEESENKISELAKQYEEIVEPDVTQTEEYKDLERKIAEKEAEKEKFRSSRELKNFLREEELALQSKLVEVEKCISRSLKNTEIDERVAELKAEQKEVAQKVADQEKMLFLLEEFIRYKMDYVSESINKKFDGISFKLFENQINGGLKETCECTVNGVPYGSLNNSHRIIAGLQIIKALQQLYGVNMPIFIDNAEAISDGNMPKMDCQMISLYVSNDKDLRIEY